ncbi:hypothetical protein jhhlp_000570 [Lomentospora prolificans]|uniref:Uncharacterized protein n=1 Tax=Lomentospora prolificans TaxID=41688 RepID=A0A2N3NLB5_9PEZI|nr:hypothetical protein jhhlp_000570 [Lomentospora prolificans]
MSSCSQSIDISTPRTPAPDRPISSLSNNSVASVGSLDQENNSPDDDHPEPFILSGTNTPAREETSYDATHHGYTTSGHKTGYSVSNDAGYAPGIPGLRAKKCPTVAVTPPAPLQASGDTLDGYFPFHEDPSSRVRPLPSLKGKQPKPQTIPSTPALMSQSDAAEQPPTDDALVTSYVPSGIHGSSLPMGKYYPTNYEKRTRRQKGLTVPIGSPISTRSAPHVPTFSSTSGSQKPRDDGDAKRKLQQYQRDMIAQATLAARKVLGNNNGTPLKLPGFPVPGLPISAPATAKPQSPRLRPLGSPGPVTPMELEAADGSYLDKGKGSGMGEKSGRDVDCSRVMVSEERLRSGTRSPSIATPAY